MCGTVSYFVKFHFDYHRQNTLHVKLHVFTNVFVLFIDVSLYRVNIPGYDANYDIVDQIIRNCS